ncbi:MAG TPA: hypothetical protein VF633_09555 [Brevundimonas sp.]|jgi:hypothetical protein
MMYVVQVDDKSLRARSDPMPAMIALKVARAWQSHGDRGVQIIKADVDATGQRSWTVRDFIAFTREGSTRRARASQIRGYTTVVQAVQATTTP